MRMIFRMNNPVEQNLYNAALPLYRNAHHLYNRILPL